MPLHFLNKSLKKNFYEFKSYSLKPIFYRSTLIRPYMLTLSCEVYDGRYLKPISLGNRQAYLAKRTFFREVVATKPIGFVVKSKKGKKK